MHPHAAIVIIFHWQLDQHFMTRRTGPVDPVLKARSVRRKRERHLRRQFINCRFRMRGVDTKATDNKRNDRLLARIGEWSGIGLGWYPAISGDTRETQTIYGLGHARNRCIIKRYDRGDLAIRFTRLDELAIDADACALDISHDIIRRSARAGRFRAIRVNHAQAWLITAFNFRIAVCIDLRQHCHVGSIGPETGFEFRFRLIDDLEKGQLLAWPCC